MTIRFISVVIGESFATARSTSAVLKVENWPPPNSARTALFPYTTLFRSTGKGAVLVEFGGGQFSTFKTALVDLAVAKLSPITAEIGRAHV